MKNVLTEFPFCLIGMTEQQARKHGRDARIDRISAAIDNDIIARAWFG